MKEVESKFYYILGFVAHSVEEDFGKAFVLYKKSVEACRTNYTAQFGLAQVFIQKARN